MTKLLKIMLVLGFFILGFSALGFSQENWTISTYYPSPMGVYRVLKLDPGAEPWASANCQPGEIYYKNTGAGILNRMYLCTDTGWHPLLLFSEVPIMTPLWKPCAGGLCKNVGGNVGIGTAAPIALLNIWGALHVITGNAIFEKAVAINNVLPAYTYALEVNGTLQADDYFSSNGSQGISVPAGINVVSSTGPCTITFENGLVVGTTCP